MANTGLGFITDWTRPRSNTLLGLGAGFLSGDLENIPKYAMEGKKSDDAYATSQKEEAQRQDQLNQTVKFLQNKGYDDLIPLVSAGQANVALQEAMKRSQPKDPATTADITNYEYAKTHPDFGGGDGGAYGGTSMDAQNANILLKGDVNSPEYAYAYNLATQPRTEFRETATGLVPIQITPTLPPGIRPPGGASGAQPSGPQLSQGPRVGMDNGLSPVIGPPVQAGSPGVSTGAALPGTAPKPTEAQQRMGLLSTSLAVSAPAVLKGFDALSDTKQQILGIGKGLTRPWQSEEYQKATVALGAAIADIVPAISGAAFSQQELATKIDSFTPKIGDKPGTVNLKKQLFLSYVQGIANASNDPAAKAKAQEFLNGLNAPSGSGSKVIDMGNGITLEEIP
jgi:hypothetical protein